MNQTIKLSDDVDCHTSNQLWAERRALQAKLEAQGLRGINALIEALDASFAKLGFVTKGGQWFRIQGAAQ